MIGRRDFITLLGGAAAGWPLAAQAQQRREVRRIGALFGLPADDPVSQVSVAGFLQGLGELGWNVGENIEIDYRWDANTNDPDRIRRYAAEVLALRPRIVLVGGSGVIVGALQQLTNDVPIVFVGPVDPVGGGRIASLARPGGNVTGFMSVEYSTAVKQLELLKRIAPNTRRAAVARDPTTPGGIGQYAAIQAAAPSSSVELTPINLRDPQEFQRALAAFAREPNGGLIVPTSGLALAQRETFVKLPAQHALPAVYAMRAFVSVGGLASYGPVTSGLYRQAAGYVDRILKGENPGDLPVQAPTKYETVLNLETAKTLGLTISPDLLVGADEVIE